MSIQTTTAELRQALDDALSRLISSCDPEQPNLHGCPRLVCCDGPSLTVELEYDTKPWAANPMGVVHGGVLATILDTAMGLTCCSLYRHFTPTISMNIVYSRPVPIPETIRVRVTVILAGRTTAQLQALLYQPSQPTRILVSAAGVYSTRTP